MFPGFPSDDNKSEDYLDEFRQKLANQSTPNFEEKRNELNRSKNIFLGAVSGVVLAGVVGWFVLSPGYSNNGNFEVPVIRRPQTAIKVQPTEPGGMEILNQDKSIYNILEKKNLDENASIENLLPPPEVPQIPVIAAQPLPQSAPIDNPAVEKIVAESQMVTTETTISQVEEIIKVAEAPQVNAAKETIVADASVGLSDVKIPTQPEAIPAKVEVPAPQASAKVVAPATSGSWQVQLMSSPNKSALESSWKNMVKKYSMLADQPHEVETADLGAKGTFYRLKAGAFQARKDADTLCNDIKAMGGSCIVKKK